MRKIAFFLTALLISGLLLPGCAKADSEDQDGTKTESGSTQQTPDDTAGDKAGVGKAAEESYTTYLEAKDDLIIRLSEAVEDLPEAEMALTSMFDVIMVDLAMWPVAFLGHDEDTALMDMDDQGVEVVSYQVGDRESSITYQDEEGRETVFTGRYDDQADWYVFTRQVDGRETLYSEYRRTPYGYVGQYYVIEDDGRVSLFQLTVDGIDGAIGLDSGGSKPLPLLGNEEVDFPLSAPEWYRIQDNLLTGVTPDGLELYLEIP